MAMISIPFTSPVGKIGQSYEHTVKLTGTGPFRLGEYFLPNGWTARIVGRTLTFVGVPQQVEQAMPAAFEVFSCDDCLPVTLTTTIDINDTCGYSWSITPTIAPVGVTTEMTFTPPRGCPSGTVLQLDLFEGDGVTPLIDLALSPHPLTVSLRPGTAKYVIQSSDSGQDIVFKPSVQQAACLAACSPSVAYQRRVVPALGPCALTFDVQPRVFSAGDANSRTTYSADGPAGCAIKIGLYDGNTPVLGSDGAHLTHLITVGSPNTQLTPWPAAAIGHDYNWRPLASGLQPACAQACALQPARIDFDVVGGTCVIQWDLSPSPVAVGQASSLRVLSGPPNCAISFQAYQADGITAISGALVTVQTDATGAGMSTPGVCDTAGVAVWKPVSPQPNACATPCSFGRTSFTHTCTSDANTGTCGLRIVCTCLSSVANTVQYSLSGLVVGQQYRVEDYLTLASSWQTVTVFTAVATTHVGQLTCDPAVFTQFRVVKVTDGACVSNVVANPCGAPPTQQYYCVTGACNLYSAAPAGALGPFATQAQCEGSCGSPGTCTAGRLLTPADVGSPLPPCGSSINNEWAGLDGAPWTHYFTVAAGAMVTVTGMPVGMTKTQLGDQLQLNWPSAVTGTYAITVTAALSGCPSCTHVVNLAVAASAATCATLKMFVEQGSSAYAPVDQHTFNAADQRLKILIEGTPGKTYTLTSTGSVATVTPITIGPDGKVSADVAIGQWTAYNTTWTLAAGGGNPGTVCVGGGVVVITGSTCVTLSVVQNAQDYVVIVSAPLGAVGVPFTLSFGGNAVSGLLGSPLCVSGNQPTVNSLLTTNSGGGLNVFTFPSGTVPAGYAACVKLTLNAGTSQNTHKLCGTTCQQVAFP
jgi:hypothetical protein